jgi:gliding motility-associated-like protein
VHIYPAPGSYSVTLALVSSFGCKPSNNFFVNVDVPPFSQLYIPTAFSPNDDGRDDMYYVFGKCIVEMTFIVYDRWGEKVFETNDPSLPWDGRYKGQMENAGVFMYSFTGTLTTGEKVNKKGNITLMR